MIDSLLKHSPYGVVNRDCSGELGCQRADGIKKNHSNAQLMAVLMAQSDTSNFPR